LGTPEPTTEKNLSRLKLHKNPEQKWVNIEEVRRVESHFDFIFKKALNSKKLFEKLKIYPVIDLFTASHILNLTYV
jgi:hypothetical protein